jgi:hypothetical protein
MFLMPLDQATKRFGIPVLGLLNVILPGKADMGNRLVLIFQREQKTSGQWGLY